MKLLPLLLFLAAGPYWQDRPPDKWTDPELIALLTNSPWAQVIGAPAGAQAPALQVFLSTAGPIELAERERDRRYKVKRPPAGTGLITRPAPATGAGPGAATGTGTGAGSVPGTGVAGPGKGAELGPDGGAAPGDVMAEEYRAWLAENRAKQIVLTVAIRDSPAFSDEQEIHRMEEESVMQIGRKKYKVTGHFPPTAHDPYLRLAFPRAATASDKSVTFDLYIPGVPMGYRSAEFRVKDMVMDGKLEM